MRGEKIRIWVGGVVARAALGAWACIPQPRSASRSGQASSASADGWIDATASLDPATTPVYEGDAPMKFEFLKGVTSGNYDLIVLPMKVRGHEGAPARAVL